MKKIIALCFIAVSFFSIAHAQIKIEKQKPVVVTQSSGATKNLTDISDQFHLQNVAVKINSNDMSVDANAQYNMGISWHKNQGSVLMLATKNNAWYNNNQMKQKNGIYIYTPTSAVMDLLLNKPAVFTLKDLQTKGSTTRGTYEMLVYGFVYKGATPAVTQTWRAAFTFQLKFSNGKTTIYKYVKIPEKTYIIGDIHNINIDFTANDVLSGDANFPADPKPNIPVIH